ncbi:MAG: hypothetical protein AB7E79_03720 [Rhodospirillaceae bacterium]
MRRLLTLAPRRVLISAAIIIFVLVMFAVLVPLLGGARDGAVARGEQLTSNITAAQGKLTELSGDQEYVQEHRAEYEALIDSDKLVPHTRRAAVVNLTESATANGLSALSYNFTAAPATSLAAVSSQSVAGGYTVAVESIELEVGAPLDGPIYRFISDIMQSFPGSLVIESMTLSRTPEISAAALAAVSAGRDAQIVEGTLSLSWRTAQADKSAAAAEKSK